MEMERSSDERKSGENSRAAAAGRRSPQKISNGAQIFLRIFVVVSSAVSAYLMLTSKEEILVYDLPMSAKYSYSPAFKFSAYMSVAASAFSLISLIITMIAIRQRSPTIYFFLFLHDLVMMALVVGGSAGASAIGYVGKHGFEEAGWLPICDHFSSFCNRATTSIMLAFASAAFLLFLSVISAINSRHIIHPSTAADNNNINVI
ncbi:hypothetical protein Dimus_006859 [Dionaea muscipula]